MNDLFILGGSRDPFKYKGNAPRETIFSAARHYPLDRPLFFSLSLHLRNPFSILPLQCFYLLLHRDAIRGAEWHSPYLLYIYISISGILLVAGKVNSSLCIFCLRRLPFAKQVDVVEVFLEADPPKETGVEWEHTSIPSYCRSPVRGRS